MHMKNIGARGCLRGWNKGSRLYCELCKLGYFFWAIPFGMGSFCRVVKGDNVKYSPNNADAFECRLSVVIGDNRKKKPESYPGKFEVG